MNYFILIPAASMIALLFAWIFYQQMMKSSEGNDKMKEIAQHVREGAMAYLKSQYTVVGKVFLVLVEQYETVAAEVDAYIARLNVKLLRSLVADHSGLFATLAADALCGCASNDLFGPR